MLYNILVKIDFRKKKRLIILIRPKIHANNYVMKINILLKIMLSRLEIKKINKRVFCKNLLHHLSFFIFSTIRIIFLQQLHKYLYINCI